MIKTQISFRKKVFVSDIQEEILPQMMSLQQHYSQLCYNNNPIDDNDITIEDVQIEVLPLTTSLKQHYHSFYNNDHSLTTSTIYK